VAGAQQVHVEANGALTVAHGGTLNLNLGTSTGAASGACECDALKERVNRLESIVEQLISGKVPDSPPALEVCGVSSISDDSDSAIALSVVGNTALSTAQSKWPSAYGTSLAFDGTGDYIDCGTTVLGDLHDPTVSFTIEAWVYLNSIPSTIAQKWHIASVLAKGTVYLAFGFAPGGVVRLYWYTGGSDPYHAIDTDASAITLSTWTHVAVVNNAGRVTIYVNGIPKALGVLGAVHSAHGTHRTYIGDNKAAGTAALNGYLNDVVVYEGVAKYLSPFQPLSQPACPVGK